MPDPYSYYSLLRIQYSVFLPPLTPHSSRATRHSSLFVIFLRHTHVVIINVGSRLRPKDANRVGIEGRSAVAIGNRILHFNGPFLRLGLTSRPSFAADMTFVAACIHA